MSHNSLFRSTMITRRQFLLTSLKGGLLSFLLLRLGYLQILKHQQYLLLSNKNSVATILVPPIRGEIFDCNARKVVSNERRFKLVITRPLAKQSQISLLSLFKILNIDDIQQEVIKKNTLGNPLVANVVENLSWEEIVKIESNIFDLQNVRIEHYFVRLYQGNESISHPIGYVSAPVQSDLQSVDIKKLKNFHVGKTGIEKYYDKELGGAFGVKHVEVDAYGKIIRPLHLQPSQSGRDLYLNLDCDLQYKVYDLIKNLSASVIVNDLQQSRLICMVSAPGFDASLFSQTLLQQSWKKMNQDAKLPLLNKAVQAAYPPGSIFKLIVCLAALKEGFDPKAKILCKSVGFLGDHFHCWNKGGHGFLNMQEAIGLSCNYYMYTIAKSIGYSKIVQMASALGFGSLVDIDLPSQVKGYLPDIFSSTFNRLQLANTLNLSIGQGHITATNLQLNKLVSIIATKGRVPEYSLLQKTILQHDVVDVASKYFDIIHEGMYRSVNLFGTGQAARSSVLIAGKTGTAQVRSKTHAAEDLSSIHTPWNQKNHALFVGFAPFDNPKYAISIVIEHGGAGGRDAAPIAKKVFEMLLL